MMNRGHEDLIAELADDLEAVRALRPRDGMLLAVTAAALTVLAVAMVAGLWNGPIEGRASPIFFIANSMLAVLGLSCAASVVRMASPGVGNRYSAAYWLLAMLAILPVVAVASAISSGVLQEIHSDPYGVDCARQGTLAGMITAAALVFWLRRGAPVDTPRAGWLTGLASGALGSAAYGLSCPIDTLWHLASWHVMPVAVAGLAGRVFLPPLLRW